MIQKYLISSLLGISDRINFSWTYESKFSIRFKISDKIQNFWQLCESRPHQHSHSTYSQNSIFPTTPHVYAQFPILVIHKFLAKSRFLRIVDNVFLLNFVIHSIIRKLFSIKIKISCWHFLAECVSCISRKELERLPVRVATPWRVTVVPIRRNWGRRFQPFSLAEAE